MPDGGIAIVCGGLPRARRCRCGVDAPFLCDWKVQALGTVHTCNSPICAGHAIEVAPDRHICPRHQAAYVLWLQRQGIAY